MSWRGEKLSTGVRPPFAGLVSPLLREDALLTMPPFPMAYRGREAIGQFFATVPAGGRLDQITLIPTRANPQPAVAAYVCDQGSGTATAYGIMVFTIDGTMIGEIAGFADPALFPSSGCPATWRPDGLRRGPR
jgi:RNA polymerase sigma-70 factor (ECF subfamily)